jgi:hypothetical protein
VVLGLKKTKHVCKELVFCQVTSHAAIATAIFSNWQWKNVLRCFPSAIITVFHTSGLLFLPKSEIRAGKLLVGPRHLQEEHVGGHTHHRYIKVHCRCPVKDRMLQKTHILLITMAKNYLKQLSLENEQLSSYVTLRICFLTHLVHL